MAGTSTAVMNAKAFLQDVGKLLEEKNAKYGDSAANPMRIFSRSDPLEQLKVRIDDKLSRIRTVGAGVQPDEDTVRDLVGYLALFAGLRQSEGARKVE